MTVGGLAAEWSTEKCAGSVAEDLWRRLDAMEIINQGMLFAATLLLCLFPFLIVGERSGWPATGQHWPGTPA